MNNLSTVTVFGKQWPVIARLATNWFLVGYEGGPVIAHTKGAGEDWELVSILSQNHDDLPPEIKRDAVQAYVDATWPIAKSTLLNL